MQLPLNIAANTLVQLLGRIATSGVTFLTTILIARQFGAEGFGDFTKITNFVALFYLISDFGFNAVFLQEKNANFAKLLTTRIVFSITLVIASILLPFVLPHSQNQGFTPFVRLGIFIYSLTIISQSLFTTTNVLFQKNQRYDKSVFASIVGSTTTLFLVVLFITLSLPLLVIVSGFIFGGMVTAVISLLFVKHQAKLYLDFDVVFIKKLVGKAFPLGLTLIFNLVYVRADWFLLTLLRDTSEVGVYGLAYKIFEFPLSLPIFFMNSLYPTLLWQVKKKKVFEKTIIIALMTSLIGSLIISASLFFFAPAIALVREDFIPSILAFRILILSLPFFFLSSLFQWVLIVLKKQNTLAVIYFLSMIVNITANLLFIPRYGFVAAAIITGLSEALVLLMLAGFSTTVLISYREKYQKYN